MELLIILHGKSWNKYKHFRQKMRHFNPDYFVNQAKLTTPWLLAIPTEKTLYEESFVMVPGIYS